MTYSTIAYLVLMHLQFFIEVTKSMSSRATSKDVTRKTALSSFSQNLKNFVCFKEMSL